MRGPRLRLDPAFNPADSVVDGFDKACFDVTTFDEPALPESAPAAAEAVSALLSTRVGTIGKPVCCVRKNRPLLRP
jgi:hypothetical protein